MLVASANPDDYTNRGRIITPLKDRFGSQIRTHYPLEIATEIAVVRQESRNASVGDVKVRIPNFMEEIIATISHLARASTKINQRSGVSVRLTTSNQELMCANAMRRALKAKETEVAPRVCDLDALAASTAGKIEIDVIDDSRESQVFDQLIRGAVLQVAKQRISTENLRLVTEEFVEGKVVQTGEDIASSDYVALLKTMPSLRAVVADLVDGDESAAVVASAIEFVLEGLHLSKRLNKDAKAGKAIYRSKTV
jgi:magnesium chelatase subunit I